MDNAREDPKEKAIENYHASDQKQIRSLELRASSINQSNLTCKLSSVRHIVSIDDGGEKRMRIFRIRFNLLVFAFSE